VSEELEHVSRLHVDRLLVDDTEERLQVERDRPQRVGLNPTRHELQIAIKQKMAERVTGLTRQRDGTNQAREEASEHVPSARRDTRGCNIDHPCIKRSVRSTTAGRRTERAYISNRSRHREGDP
jgi:hypothetical protein